MGPHKHVFTSRDRFGVKPFYYANTTNVCIWQQTKALLQLGYNAGTPANAGALADYIVNVQLDRGPQIFWIYYCSFGPGHNLSLDIWELVM